MAAELNKKTLRHFYCRDTLWQSFERMSEDLDRGIDDLVNEAMRLLAREKGYVAAEGDGRPPSNMKNQPVRVAPPAPPPPPVAAPPLPPPRATTAGRPAVGGVTQGRPPSVEHLPVDRPAGALYLTFQNQKYLIDKDQFIIGRGSKSSDLPIRDGNISRKHAAVVRRNGAYFIKDLGSTNGIDFNGARVDNKRIEEGDVFSICEYQLKFSYH